MASTKTRVHSTALKIIKRIEPGEPDELNVRRFSRLAGMLRDEQTTWRVLDEHDKASIIRDARERLAEANRKRKNPELEGGIA